MTKLHRTNIASDALMGDLYGATFLGIDTLINQPLTGGKKNPMQGRITKAHYNATVVCAPNHKSSIYVNKVFRHLEKLGLDPANYVPQPRKWGTRVTGFPIIEHTIAGVVKHYFEVIYLRPGTSSYFLDGAPIAKELIEGLPVLKASETGQGGLPEEDRVQLRTYLMDSIVQIRINQMKVVGPFYFDPN
jgi:hypothetical protein